MEILQPQQYAGNTDSEGIASADVLVRAASEIRQAVRLYAGERRVAEALSSARVSVELAVADIEGRGPADDHPAVGTASRIIRAVLPKVPEPVVADHLRAALVAIDGEQRCRV